MTHVTTEILDIAASALAPWEDLGVPRTDPAAVAEAESLLRRWEEHLTRFAPAPGAFEARLRELGLSRADACRRLTRRRLDPAGPIPDWVAILGKVLAVRPHDRGETVPATASERAEPLFPALMHPFVSHAMDVIRDESACLDFSVDAPALASIERYLLGHLSDLAARAVARELAGAATAGSIPGDSPEARYLAYVERYLGSRSGRLALLRRYAVLARLLATCAEQTGQALAELLRRLARDSREIEACFFEGRALDAVAGLEPGLSDSHEGGRTVCRLRFSGGGELIYKPRPTALEAAYYSLVERLNATGEMPRLRAARALAREAYGWCEHVAAGECGSHEEVGDFYRRQGAEAALLYLLVGADMHHENIVPSGAWPVSVDLETLLAPTGLPAPDPSLALAPWERGVHDSALSTGMLPQWAGGDADRLAIVFSGITGAADRPQPVARPAWEGLGTDRLRRVREYRTQRSADPRPRLDGRTVAATDYVADILVGFEDAYRAVSRHREALLSDLAAFAADASRCLVRNTRTYQEFLEWSVAPPNLVSGGAHDVAFELLALRDTTPGLDVPGLVDDEKRALWRRDVPRFQAVPGSRALRSATGARLEPATMRGGRERAQQRLELAGEEDLEWQRALARTSLRMSLEPGGDRGPDTRDLRQRALACAVGLGESLERITLRGAWGATWLSLHRARDRAQISIDPCNANLYAGTAGVALFLANLSARTGEPAPARLAREALAHAETDLRRALEQRLALPAAAFTGAGSLMYAFAEVGRCLADPDLVDRAVDWARRLDAESAPAPESCDVIGGAAGMLLVLLHLHRMRPEDRLLEYAVRLGEQVAGHQAPGEGPAGFQVAGRSRAPLGMGHGASGSAYALARLHRETGRPQLARAARRALAYERGCFDAEREDWPNFLSDAPEPTFATGWCAGAPGIALARLGMLGCLGNDDELRSDLELALAATQRHLSKPNDHLCCGDMGRILASTSPAGGSIDRSCARTRWKRRTRCCDATRSGASGGYRRFASAPFSRGSWAASRASASAC